MRYVLQATGRRRVSDPCPAPLTPGNRGLSWTHAVEEPPKEEEEAEEIAEYLRCLVLLVFRGGPGLPMPMIIP